MKLSAIAVALAGVFLFSPGGAFAQAINDAQIASIVVTANQVDIDAGRLAAMLARDAEIKKFGQLMVTDHCRGRTSDGARRLPTNRSG